MFETFTLVKHIRVDTHPWLINRCTAPHHPKTDDASFFCYTFLARGVPQNGVGGIRGEAGARRCGKDGLYPWRGGAIDLAGACAVIKLPNPPLYGFRKVYF